MLILIKKLISKVVKAGKTPAHDTNKASHEALNEPTYITDIRMDGHL